MPQDEREQRFLDHLQVISRDRSQLLPALWAGESTFGFLSAATISAVAEHLRMPVSVVDGIATAYPDFHRSPPPLHAIRVCNGPACTCMGGARLAEALTARVADLPGTVVERTACLFVCALAPAIQVDEHVHGRVSIDAAEQLTRDLAADTTES